MEESFTLAHEFLLMLMNVNVSLQKGDLVGLKIDVIHDCCKQEFYGGIPMMPSLELNLRGINLS